MDRGELLVAFAENPTLLLQAFPRHAQDLPKAIETVPALKGRMEWKDFCNAGLLCLSCPGSSPV